ncbi:PilN domain-containing protein [Candidatus Gottesmanbacteria bacterium]|nr:PilN domain-containing protein [Candidatus Gottesmanbacteria bacterium]
MPATSVSHIDINLIGEGDFSNTPIGRVITWATTYGRYIMILTEIIVLLAFISRFSLDRKLTDLNEEISQKQAIIETNSDLEQRIRTIQQKLKGLGTLVSSQSGPSQTLQSIRTALPPDVYLESLDISEKSAKLAVIAGTTQGIASLLTNLAGNPRFGDIQVGDISSKQAGGTQFDVTIHIGPTPAPKKKP